MRTTPLMESGLYIPNNDAMQKAINEAALATVEEFHDTYDTAVMDKIVGILNDKLA